MTRPTLWHYVAKRDELEWRANDVLTWVKNGQLKLRMEHIYALAEAPCAQADMEILSAAYLGGTVSQ